MTVVWLLAAVAAGFALWRIGRRLRFFLHVLQLEGYRPGNLLAWTFARPADVLFRRSHALGVVVLGLLGVGLFRGPVGLGAGFALWAVAFASSRRYRRDRPKKPLVWTARMKRLGVVTALPAVAVSAAGAIVAFDGAPFGHADAASLLAGLWIADLAAPLWAAAGAVLLEPLERWFRAGFKRRARARLAARPDLTVVAITGSYGKTSVKFAAAEVLSQRYAVLATPGSYNTPMGICTVINRDLKPWHQVLILEMGIRHPGDIAELTAIARPDIAVVTGIGVAHLESMGSREAIAREKGSILDALRADGIAVLNADDAYFDELAARAPGRVVAVSASGDAPADLVGSDPAFDDQGTRFDVTAPGDRRFQVRTPLLGRHHVLNQLLALAVGHELGIRLRAGARALGRLRPVAHRLSVREEAGVTILDDAFNSNPVGARNALEVLGAFQGGNRFVVTPGMIELGERQESENEAFGRAMARHADVAVLVGPERTRAIARGLRDAGFPDDRIHVVKTLYEARSLLARQTGPGDTVLYENDLPDQYTESS